MAKYTTSIHDYLRNELINNGYDEFFKNGRFTSDAFITRLIKQDTVNDKEFLKVMKKCIFENFYFEFEDLDNFFKTTFLFNFFYHEIKFQTIELFKLQLLAFMYEKKQAIEFIYDNFEAIISNSNTDTTDGKTQIDNQNRTASTTTPQDEINLDVSNNNLNYADENTVALNQSINKNNSTSKKSNLKIEDIYSTLGLYRTIFNEMEERLFLQIF